MFDIRPLQEHDYDMLFQWWKWWRWQAPPRECLPNEGLGGIMVYKDSIPVCAGFLYFTNSKMAWLEFIVSNPEYRDKDRKEALQLLIHELTGIAQRKGYKAVFASVKNKSLINHYEACGYTVNKDCAELVKAV